MPKGKPGGKRLVPLTSGLTVNIRWLEARVGYANKLNKGVQWFSCGPKPEEPEPVQEVELMVTNPASTFAQIVVKETDFVEFSTPCS